MDVLTSQHQESNSPITYDGLSTEQINPDTKEIDLLSTPEMLTLINQADQHVPVAIQDAIPQISHVVERIVQAFQTGGRLIYFGAGTSGRLGVLDASECPPTYGTPPEWVQAYIAGGDIALRHAIEGAEDDPELAQQDADHAQFNSRDVVVGLSASGSAAYVKTALELAKASGAFTSAITCNPQATLLKACDIPIIVPVGPEVIAGSTRLKAGTMQKLVLNMLTTGAMIQLGKTYENWMVDVKPTNLKLKARAVRIVCQLANTSPEFAEQALMAANTEVKTAIVMLAKNVSATEARNLLQQVKGRLRQLL
jgi:N-acetylmuramic acid 6-phosphate etherase